MLGNTIVVTLILALFYSVVLILLELRLEEQLVVIGAMILFGLLCWKLHADCDENDFDIMG